MKIANIVGARPNFMKIAPIHRTMSNRDGVEPILIHTGQHYDKKMSESFFIDLGMPKPDVYLGVGSGSHAEQTAAVMIKMEKVLLEEKPDVVVVVGDVNSTIAATMAASKLHIPVAHVEAGLRSFDRSMPEEINRILTDSIADLLFVTEHSGLVNLAHEGVDKQKIHLVGNVMIDSLVDHLHKAEALNSLEKYGMNKGDYVLMTMHRPANVDHSKKLSQILSVIQDIQKEIPVIFPIHPRTAKQIEKFDLNSVLKSMDNLILTDPLGYLEFLDLMSKSRILLTDSGGIQEETTFLKIPCITMRENTERPITLEFGTNQLVGSDPEKIYNAFNKAMHGNGLDATVPPLWDGYASVRIVDVLEKQNLVGA